ncbi:hypothetical protein [Streptomyces sp. NPDC053367]|uniref:hypothetical protein n=1 Tax=Streptomyces sp. NPDC053367 TaxID=3365700 RepID=UPI0037D32173
MPDAYHTISREYPDGRRIIAVVTDTDDPVQKSDEEILDDLEALMEKDRPE